MKLDRAKYFVIFMTVLGLVFVAGFIVMLIAPTFRELRDISAKIVAAESEVQAQYASRKSLLSSIENLQAVRLLMKDLASQFVPVGSELGFITAIENVGDANGAEVRLRLLGEAPKESNGEFSQGFEVDINGPYASAMRTLEDIERLPVLVAIDALTVTGGPTAAPDPTTSVSIKITGQVATPPKGL